MMCDLIREKIFQDTAHLKVGDHWRFQHQIKTIEALNIDFDTLTEIMAELCERGYFERIEDGLMIHYIVLKKPNGGSFR